MKPLETFFLADLFSSDSPHRSGFQSSEDTRGWWESVSYVLNFEVLPTRIFTTLLSTAPHFEGELTQIAQNVRKAFCGNGFIHLNIAEIHEEDNGGQKRRAPIGDQASK